MDSHRTTLKRAGPAPSVVLGALVVVAAAMFAFRAREDGPSGLMDSPPSSTRFAPMVQASIAPMLGGTGLSDPLTVAALLGDVSADRPVRDFLRESDWLRRAILVTEALAAGRVPRDVLRFAAPAGPLAVEQVGRDTVIGPASYHRYDGFADAVGSISPAALRAVFVAVRSSIDSAYRSLGGRSAPFEEVVARALVRVEVAPAGPGDLVVRPEGGRFVFMDPRLEALGDLEKQLLRMGPRNARLVQDKAKEIREELGLSAMTALAR
jgi:hypothetical protein